MYKVYESTYLEDTKPKFGSQLALLREIDNGFARKESPFKVEVMNRWDKTWEGRKVKGEKTGHEACGEYLSRFLMAHLAERSNYESL
jgi:hypothetical protein